MALTIGQVLTDLLQDIPEVVNLVNKIESAVQAFPAAGSFKADAQIIADILPDVGGLVDLLKSQFGPGATPPPALGRLQARLSAK